MTDKEFYEKLLVIEKVFSIKATAYKVVNGKETEERKNGAELILEYQKLVSLASSALHNNKISNPEFVKIDNILREVYNKYILENDLARVERKK